MFMALTVRKITTLNYTVRDYPPPTVVDVHQLTRSSDGIYVVKAAPDKLGANE